MLQSLARRTGNSDMYEGITHDTEPLIMPPNVSHNIKLVTAANNGCADIIICGHEEETFESDKKRSKEQL